MKRKSHSCLLSDAYSSQLFVRPSECGFLCPPSTPHLLRALHSRWHLELKQNENTALESEQRIMLSDEEKILSKKDFIRVARTEIFEGCRALPFFSGNCMRFSHALEISLSLTFCTSALLPAKWEEITFIHGERLTSKVLESCEEAS